ncbi:ABC transporter permease subunit [Cobetia sp. LC6]|uniref:ABC transporter permease subunit n=1 Tax=Cobetia sp. LC6 TaxID=3050947 RepID=UPI00255278F4|nr:ABC transporter permease subunit [Cobetia sp. LC6]MDL2190958.1 ABC transporter permease subunit [Cobetia sp. LC6]
MSAVDASRMQRRRLRHDRLASLWLTAAGLGVMVIVVVMLAYLVSVSWPLLKPASVKPLEQQAIDQQMPAAQTDLDWLSDPDWLSALPGMRLFARDGLPPVLASDDSTADLRTSPLAGVWLADDRLQVVQQSAAGIRLRGSAIEVPAGLERRQASLVLSRDQLWLRIPFEDGDGLWLARLTLSASHATAGALDGDAASQPRHSEWQQQWLPGTARLSSQQGRLLVTADRDGFTQWQLSEASSGTGPLARKLAHHAVSSSASASSPAITALSVLRGGRSLIVGDAAGGLTHYLLPAHAQPLVKAGVFDSGLSAPVVTMAAAHHSLGFAALDANGRLGLYLATSERRRQVLDWLDASRVATGVALEFDNDDHRLLASAVREARLPGQLAQDAPLGALGKAYAGLAIHDPHQAVGLDAIFGKVWYEGRAAPEWIWQLESTGTHEPRLSLVPIMWGTLKAALAGLLFAVPLGLGCAIHVACFMAPRQRSRIKPLLEMMEALPTVVIGFIAALVVAPFVERELMAVLLGLVLIPLGTMAAGFLWTLAPRAWRNLLPENMAAFGLLPLLFVLLWLDVTIAGQVEQWWFDGDLRQWLFSHYGIDYAQRNTLVTGMALGLAVMPTLFTLSEDALSSVPRGLAAGSAALGATPWQSLRRVILPAAAVGLFSAMMIGMGRAVGETMIVLMVAGNTPLVDASLFEGLRSLAATLAIELPEAEVGSSHYRLLFLAALALFVFTFVVNTLAEVLRQRFTPPNQGSWG